MTRAQAEHLKAIRDAKRWTWQDTVWYARCRMRIGLPQYRGGEVLASRVRRAMKEVVT